MANSDGRFEIPGMEEKKTVAKSGLINKTSMERLEKALLPYEKQLLRQEYFRKALGVN